MFGSRSCCQSAGPRRVRLSGRPALSACTARATSASSAWPAQRDEQRPRLAAEHAVDLLRAVRGLEPADGVGGAAAELPVGHHVALTCRAQQVLRGEHGRAAVGDAQQRPRRQQRGRARRLLPERARHLAAQAREHPVEAVAGAGGVLEVAVAVDLGRPDPVLLADVGAQLAEPVPLRGRRRARRVGALVLDARRRRRSGPVQCAPSTWRRRCAAPRGCRCRPSSTKPPRLIVKCWPVSIQPRRSMWKFWIPRASGVRGPAAEDHWCSGLPCDAR